MNVRKYKLLFLLSIQLIFIPVLKAQDIEQIAKAKWLTVSGGIGANASAYSSLGAESRRDPFSYSLSANLNLNFKGVVDAPFAFLMTSQNKTFNTPAYNFVGISPRYKWITAHIGSRNMTMSQYTYSGTTFLGGGLELMPEKLLVKGKAFYGRLVKAVTMGDTLSPVMRMPAYERWGGAGMITIGTPRNNVDFIVFKGKDNVNSLGIIDSTIAIKPEENVVIGINTKHKIGERISFAIEYGFSAYTRDTRQEYVLYDDFTYVDNFGSFFKPRASSYYAHAINIRTDYQADIFTIGLGYQRIDPNYQTMGALYMTNDIQDITVNGTLALLENKINMSGSFGYQRNNLMNKSEAIDKRFISSVNVSYSITENLNTSVNFSNYNTSTEAVRIIMYDSIKYAQINNNLSLSASYNIPGEQLNHSFDFSAMMQNASTINNEFTQIESTNNQMNGLNLGYRLGFGKTDFSIALNASGNQNVMQGVKDYSGGPGITFTKSFFKKTLQTSLGFNSYFSKTETANSTNVNTTRATVSYRFFKKHSVNLSTNYMNRSMKSATDGSKKSGELMGNIAYSFSF